MRAIIFSIIAVVVILGTAYAKFGFDTGMGFGSGSVSVSGPVEPSGHYLLIDGAGHYLLIDNSSNQILIDGAN